MLVLPAMRRELPEARLPFERQGVIGAMLATAAVDACRARVAPRPAREGARRRRDRARARACSRCAAASSPPTTAPSTSRSAATSTAAARRRSTSAAARTSSARSSSRPRSATRSPRARPSAGAARRAPSRRVGALGGRDRDLRLDGAPPRASRLARALAWPGHELQHRLSTAEPSAEQLEVAEAALATCLKLEHGHREPGRERLAAGDLRPPGREDAGGLLHGRVLQPHAHGAARRRPPPARRDAGLPEARVRARRDGRGDRDPQALLGRLGRARPSTRSTTATGSSRGRR